MTRLSNALRCLAMATALMVSGTAKAETSLMFSNPENKAYFGLRVGVDISSAANGGDYYSNNPGVQLGAIYNIPVKYNLYFEPGLSVFYNVFGTLSPSVAQVSTTVNGETTTTIDPALQYIDGSIRNLGFRVPLIIGYHFDFTEAIKVNVFTGPELNLNIMARYHNSMPQSYTTDEGAVVSYSEYEKNQSLFGTGGFRHADLGWQFGVGVSYLSYYLGFSGSVGITNMKTASLPHDFSAITAGTPTSNYLPRDIRRNIFTITLGYNF